MSRARAYFQDRLILLILTINTFLGLALIVTSVLALADTNAGYIKEYRSNLGLDGFKAGEVKDILAFGVFAIIVYAFQLVISMRIYHIRRHISLIILLLTMILFIFALLALNALLGLR